VMSRRSAGNIVVDVIRLVTQFSSSAGASGGAQTRRCAPP
jgi:hypothetical protein